MNKNTRKQQHVRRNKGTWNESILRVLCLGLGQRYFIKAFMINIFKIKT